MTTPLEVLKKYWKHDEFRWSQEDIIHTVLDEKDTIVLLPTGAGKSLCFQIPALIKEGVCIVISPLIALMDDQVKNLKQKGIKAAVISASLNQNSIVQLFDNIIYGGTKFVYLSPERLQSPFIQEKLKQLNVNLIAIDEAHCISEWGHDFRPSYRKINVLRELQPKAPIIALTATATEKVFKDIIDNLQIENITQFKVSLKRPELAYSVLKSNTINYTTVELLKNVTNSSIVYTTTRKSARNISAYINHNGLKSTYYHGGLSLKEKNINSKEWFKEASPIMVATNAFGMGIDKKNVEIIIHADLPFSLENYMQESGRAGRNKQSAKSYILYNDSTIDEFKRRQALSFVPIDYIKEVYLKLNHYYRISKGEKPIDNFKFDIALFCKNYDFELVKTHNAIDVLEKEGVLQLSDSIQRKSLVKFNSSSHQLINYTKTHLHHEKIIKSILRTYPGLFDQLSKIDESVLAIKLNTDTINIVKQLKELEGNGTIIYQPKHVGNVLNFLVPREDDITINVISKNIRSRYKIKQEKIEKVLDYISTNQCRSRFLLNYFGEQIPSCGKCDFCIEPPAKSNNIEEIVKVVLAHIGNQSLTSRDIVSHLNYDKNLILKTLQLLLDTDKIKLTSHNKFQVNNNA